MSDKLKRYFVGNRAPIFSVRLFRWWSKFIPCRTGNSHGFYLGPLLVQWRRPYADCWRWNERRGAWEIDQ